MNVVKYTRFRGHVSNFERSRAHLSSSTHTTPTTSSPVTGYHPERPPCGSLTKNMKTSTKERLTLNSENQTSTVVISKPRKGECVETQEIEGSDLSFDPTSSD